MKLNDMSFKMGQDGTNTANAGLSINLPLFAPAVYRAMSMTKTDIELAVEKSRASELDLINQVTKAYYQLMLAQDSYCLLYTSKLLDYSNDEDHNRLVVTLVGEPEALRDAVIEAIGIAVRLIDLNHHSGQHPRMGAVDVVPFIPIKNTTMEEDVYKRQDKGNIIRKRLNGSVFL